MGFVPYQLLDGAPAVSCPIHRAYRGRGSIRNPRMRDILLRIDTAASNYNTSSFNRVSPS